MKIKIYQVQHETVRHLLEYTIEAKDEAEALELINQGEPAESEEILLNTSEIIDTEDKGSPMTYEQAIKKGWAI